MQLSHITDIAVAGLRAQRTRIAASASNLANAETTRTEAGGPYRRRDPVFATRPVGGPFGDRLDRAMKQVFVQGVRVDAREPLQRFQPGHPDADAEGFVSMPRVNPVEEMTNMMSASRSFEANLLIIRKVREMARAAVQLGNS